MPPRKDANDTSKVVPTHQETQLVDPSDSETAPFTTAGVCAPDGFNSIAATLGDALPEAIAPFVKQFIVAREYF